MIRKKIMQENSSQSNTTLLLQYRKPLSLKQILSFMKHRAIKGIEVVTDNSYCRTFRINNTTGFFTVTDNPEQSALELKIQCDDIKCYMEVYNRVRKMFDLDTDFRAINAKFSADSLLSRGMEDGHVPRLPMAFYPFEFVIRAILGQQISVKAATTLAARIAEKAAIQCDNNFPDGLDYFFPNPFELIKLDIDGLGITTTRQTTIKTVTQAVIDKAIQLTPNQQFDTFQKNFLSLKGVGNWTVSYVAMRGMGMMDSFPASDLGVIRAFTEDGEIPSTKEITAMAEKWRPYRSYATLCLWNYENKKDR
jgi:AraC family transcriptional regulator of adaptative response / DNA-3-methyladenine glycosylase II